MLELKRLFSFFACVMFFSRHVLSIVLCFSGLGYCERILQASSSLDRGSDFSCQGCWLGSQGACVSRINCFQGCSWKALYLACEQAHLWVTRATGEEQSDPAGRSLVKRRHKSHFLVLRLRLSCSPRALVLLREPGLVRSCIWSVKKTPSSLWLVGTCYSSVGSWIEALWPLNRFFPALLIQLSRLLQRWSCL